MRLLLGILISSCLVACATLSNKQTDGELDYEAFAGCRNNFFQEQWRGQAVPQCPVAEGLVLLPPTYPPGLVFLGYAPQPVYVQFLREIIERLVEDANRPQIAILIPRYENGEVYRLFKKYLEPPYSDFVRFVPTPAEESLWAQDYFEVAISTDSGRGTLIDLPFENPKGESIPAAVALSCQMDLIPQETTLPKSQSYPAYGDFGGNIESFPGNLVVAGNNLTATTQKVLEVNLSQDTLTVDTAWGEPGHVDEVFGVLPVRNAQPGSCDFTITYASPQLAIELLKSKGSESKSIKISPEVPEGKDAIPVVDRVNFSKCYELIANNQMKSAKRKLKNRCEAFLKANEAYSVLIDKGLAEILEAVKKRTNCQDVEAVPLPLLFAPEKIKAVYGKVNDHAISLNPNPINNISLGPLVVVARQPFGPFQDHIDQKLKSFGLDIQYIEGAYVHYLRGGIHNASSVVRMCRPQPNTNSGAQREPTNRPPKGTRSANQGEPPKTAN